MTNAAEFDKKYLQVILSGLMDYLIYYHDDFCTLPDPIIFGVCKIKRRMISMSIQTLAPTKKFLDKLYFITSKFFKYYRI